METKDGRKEETTVCLINWCNKDTAKAEMNNVLEWCS